MSVGKKNNKREIKKKIAVHKGKCHAVMKMMLSWDSKALNG